MEQAIEQTGARLVVLDPIQGYIGASVDMHRANEIRPLMYRIAKLAEKYGCAILLIGHMNKNSGEKSSYRGLGSIDFQAAARSVIRFGKPLKTLQEKKLTGCISLLMKHIAACRAAKPEQRLPSCSDLSRAATSKIFHPSRLSSE